MTVPIYFLYILQDSLIYCKIKRIGQIYSSFVFFFFLLLTIGYEINFCFYKIIIIFIMLNVFTLINSLLLKSSIKKNLNGIKYKCIT